MNILHVVPTYLPARRYGGPIVAVHGLCRALVAAGHRVSVFTTNVDGAGTSNVPTDGPVDLDGVSVHYFPSSFPRLYWSPRMGVALREMPADGFDLVHLHSVFLWPTMAAARAARGAGVPYVVSPRGMLVPELILRKSRWVKTAWLRLIEHRTFAEASAIHFTSQREWDDARLTGIPLPSPFVVGNGIDLPPESPSDRDPRTIVFMGRINWKKGLDRLIEAMALVPDARLEIAGNDEENLTPRLEDLASRVGVRDRTAFLGHVGGAEKDALLARATLFALPSLSENFGNAVLEAMSMGTPVVVTPEVGLAREIDRAGAGRVVAGDPRQLGAAFAELLSDSARRATMGERARTLVEQQFTWTAIAQSMEKAYGRIIAAASSGRP